MGKPSSKGLNQRELMEIAQQQQFMNNPNQHNMFGSTETTFDPVTGQATINQTADPTMMQGIQRQQNFLAQGPSTMGTYNNPLGEMFAQQANRYFDRAGMQMGDFNLNNAGYQGGFTPQATLPEQSDTPIQPQDGGFNGLGVGMQVDGGGVGVDHGYNLIPKSQPQTGMLNKLKQGANATPQQYGQMGRIGGALASLFGGKR